MSPGRDLIPVREGAARRDSVQCRSLPRTYVPSTALRAGSALIVFRPCGAEPCHVQNSSYFDSGWPRLNAAPDSQNNHERTARLNHTAVNTRDLTRGRRGLRDTPPRPGFCRWATGCARSTGMSEPWSVSLGLRHQVAKKPPELGQNIGGKS